MDATSTIILLERVDELLFAVVLGVAVMLSLLSAVFISKVWK
jgi:hypothetical protein